MFTWTTIAQILWTSFATASYYVLFAVAFSLVLKVNGVFNFAQAGLMTVAFYAAHASIAWAGLGGPMSFAAALTATLISAWGLEHFGFATMRRNQASPMFAFIFTIVTSEFVAYLAMLLFGTWPKTIFPQLFWPVTLVGDIAVSAWDVPALLSASGAVAVLWGFMRYSRRGQFMVAVADNPSLAEFYGIDRQRVFTLTMLIAGVAEVINADRIHEPFRGPWLPTPGEAAIPPLPVVEDNGAFPERRHRIVELLNQHGKVTVEALAARFATSAVTIRTDLAALEASGDDRQAAETYALRVQLNARNMRAEFDASQIPGLRDWWIGRAYGSCVARSGQSAAFEKALREQISRQSNGGADPSGERVPRMLLAFLLDGQGKESLAMSEWQSMVARSGPKAASLPPAQPQASAKTGI